KFNIFQILRKKGDEVNLHSKFIAELLNPKGSHGFEDVFLKSFIENVELGDNQFQVSKKAAVCSEKYIDAISEDKTKGGRIDILIDKIGDNPIIIENKIYADDQENQLLRYSNFNDEGILVYLTLYGDEPSEKSLGTVPLTDVKLISYKNDISKWIEDCIRKSARTPSIREALIQYQKLINDLTGNSTTMEERMEILNLISKKDNIKAAKKIADNWIHLRWHTEWDFWTEFQQRIEFETEYKVSDENKYSDKKLTSVIHNSRNRNPWYGITLKIGTYRESETCVMVQRGLGNLCFGLKVENKDLTEEVQEKLTPLNLTPRAENWIINKEFSPKINLESFENDATLLLSNPEERKTQLENLTKQLLSFVDDCKNLLEIEPLTNTSHQNRG
ncbi:MAG: hypothetical protein ACI9LA_002081, partial [Bacteroidia bacterium]